MGNWFANLALFAFPLFVFFLFNRFSKAVAIVVSILSGYLFLPEVVSFKVPALPDLDKTTASVLSVLAACIIFRKPRNSNATVGIGAQTGEPSPLSGRNQKTRAHRIFTLLAVVALTMPLLTYLSNQEPLIYGPTYLPGMGLYDGLSFVQGVIILLVPFYLGFRYLREIEDQTVLLKAVAIAGLVYAFPVLFEIRLSPQLHTWVYGFFPHSFAQQFRDGGYRAVVFLAHGLWVAIFLCMACIACWCLSVMAEGTKMRTRWRLAALFLMGVLVLQKSLGALFIAVTLAAFCLFLRQKQRIIAIAAVGLIILSYPVLRGADLVPLGSIFSFAELISPDRAESLQTRLTNESQLLEKANEKPLLGWGGYGRNRIYDSFSGNDLSITDGYWVIVIGTYGWIGYLAIFGLLTLPVILLARHQKRFTVYPTTVGLGTVLAANLIDIIPNSGQSPLTWLIAGSIAGGMANTNHISNAARLDEPTKGQRPERGRIVGVNI